MKKLLLLCVLLAAGVQAQIVNIPNPAFKTFLLSDGTNAQNAAGEYIAIDANGDGEIQQSEANQVVSIQLNISLVTTFEGINSFFNLEKVYISLSPYGGIAPPYMLDLQGLQHLSGVWINGTGQVSLSNLPSLDTLSFYAASPTSITIESCPNLESVTASQLLAEELVLDLSGCAGLKDISFTDARIAGLDVHGTDVEDITLIWCDMDWLNADATPNLESLKVHSASTNLGNYVGPGLSSLSVNGSGVKFVEMWELEIESLDFSQANQLEELTFFGEEWAYYLTDLNLSGCNHLKVLDVFVLNTSVLDLTDCTSLETVRLGWLDSATAILAKNGAAEDFVWEYSWWLGDLDQRLWSLQLFCIDESQFDAITGEMAELSDVVVSPYCSFVPGGDYNTLSGSITLDGDGDGCDTDDPVPAFQVGITIDQGYYGTLAREGNYEMFLPFNGDYVIQPLIVDNPSYFTVAPSSVPISITGTTSVADVNFCITPNGIHHDVEVTIAPLGVIRPGFDASYAVTYRNKGNQVENGQVSFQFDDDKLDVVSTSQAPANSATGNLSWNFTGLLPYESRTIIVTVNANSPVETPAVNIGDIMTYNSNVTLLQTDENPDDNTFAFLHTVVGAYDPNDITCLEGDIVSPSLIGTYLHYHVNFENTGNFPAENVVVRVKMDTSKFDMTSLQFMGSSHQPQVRRNGNLVEFIFEGIQLPAAGKGYVQFKIKSKNTLVVGNSVSQKADIYFDFNAPVATNVATTTFQQLSTVTPSAEAFVLWPNPASDVITISGAADIEAVSILNLLGQQVYKQDGNGRGAQVNVSSLPTGNYLVRVKAAEGEQLLKLVKK